MSGTSKARDEHNWTGTSATRVVDGEVVPKRTALTPFVVHTVVAIAGLVLVLRYAGLSWPLHALGIVLALVGTVASHGYRPYSHWFGLVVVVVTAGSVVLQLSPSV